MIRNVLRFKKVPFKKNIIPMLHYMHSHKREFSEVFPTYWCIILFPLFNARFYNLLEYLSFNITKVASYQSYGPSPEMFVFLVCIYLPWSTIFLFINSIYSDGSGPQKAWMFAASKERPTLLARCRFIFGCSRWCRE